MSLTPEQEAAVRAPASIAVTAGAGTGKTHLLTQRYLHHLTADGWSPLQIVAVTFTERAAAELRARIRSAVGADPTAAEATLADLEAAQISTIHALAARICRDHYDLAGIPPDFAVLDEQEGAIWRGEHFATALEAIPLEIFRTIPFSTLSQALRTFLNDPHSAEAALAQGPEQWAVEIERAREEELHRLREHPEWRALGAEIEQVRGGQGDKLEVYRAAACAAWKAIQAGEPPHEHFLSISGVKLNVGAQKNWPGETLTPMKAALRRLRELALGSQPMATLSMSELDDRVAEMIPLFLESFRIVQDSLDAAKRRTRRLDFNDLERYALRILKQPTAQAYYRDRWRAFLIDEFQDTNPVQGRLLELLTKDARLTIVGDEQQSIYGFRRAEVEVFRGFRREIDTGGGKGHRLSVTYRAHGPLIDSINAVFSAVLGTPHEGLSAHRVEAPHTGPHVSALVVESDPDISKSAGQLVEAAAIAREVRGWIDRELPIHDRPGNTVRAVTPGDIAVLARTWDALDFYADALTAAGVPVAHAGGGSLLDTREALDAISLLTFLADEQDDLALAAVLRSPFFAVSDRELYLFASRLKQNARWWPSWTVKQPVALAPAFRILTELRAARPHRTPRELLQLADSLTGYGAVIANLPASDRRQADWHGFLELLSSWERNGINDAFLAVRQLHTMTEAEIAVPRPPLETGNAVALMTVHAAKGLEWPIVIVPDLTRRPPGDRHRVRFDPQLGVALAFEGDDDEKQKPAILTLIDHRRAEREAAEARRVLYVALTRARDRLLLTAAESKGNALDILLPGLAAAGIEVQTIPFDEADVRPPELATPPAQPRPTATWLDPVPRSVDEVRITTLQEYAVCPKRFHYHVVLGFPDPSSDEPDGAGETVESDHVDLAGDLEASARIAPPDELPLFAEMHAPVAPTIDSRVAHQARRIGILAHRALELGIANAEGLARCDARLAPEQISEALRLAQTFRAAPAFARFNGPGSLAYRREWPVATEADGIRLIGTIDLAGPDFVLDYKTGSAVDPAEYRFQLWAYARAARVSTAYLADLRRGELHTFDSDALAAIEQEVAGNLDRMRAGNFDATPSPTICRQCSYARICPESLARH